MAGGPTLLAKCKYSFFSRIDVRLIELCWKVGIVELDGCDMELFSSMFTISRVVATRCLIGPPRHQPD